MDTESSERMENKVPHGEKRKGVKTSLQMWKNFLDDKIIDGEKQFWVLNRNNASCGDEIPKTAMWSDSAKQ